MFSNLVSLSGLITYARYAFLVDEFGNYVQGRFGLVANAMFNLEIWRDLFRSNVRFMFIGSYAWELMK